MSPTTIYVKTINFVDSYLGRIGVLPTTLNYPTDMVCNVRIGIPTSYDSYELILIQTSKTKF